MPKTIQFCETMSKISEAFGTTKDMNALLKLIVESAVETMKGKAACLFLADETKELYRPVAQVGLSDSYLHAQASQSEHIAPLLLKEGFIYYRDASKDPRQENRDIKKAEGIGSILVVPAIIKNELIGVLALYTSKIREFDPEEIDFLRVLAGQGAIAIENARLVDTLRMNTKIFSDLAASIASSLDVKTILQTLTEEVCTTLNIKASSIRLLNDERTTLQMVASFGLSDKYKDKMVVWAEKSITEALNGKPVMIVDVASDKTVRRRKEKEEEGIVSLLTVPIRAKEEVIGILRLYSGFRRVFTEDEILLVSALANLGGLAIQNAALYLMLQSDLKEMKESTWTHKCWF
mgnify:FL=1